jgi:DHA2 family multidrug resistance protein
MNATATLLEIRNEPVAEAGAAEAVAIRHWAAVLGAFMAVLDIQNTNASLNDILGSPGATLDAGSSVSTS